MYFEESLLSLWMDLTSGMMNIQLIPQYPVIGESATLSVTGVTGNIVSITWYKGPNTTTEYHILTYLTPGNPPLLPGPPHNSRVTHSSNGSLLISDLTIADSNNYTVKIQTENPEEQASVILTVYERVSKPKVTAPTSQPKENDTFTLTCDTRNAERILWSRNSVSLPSGPILSADNRTVTFSRVTRGDSGDYRCEAANPASKNTSDPYPVTVSYFPQMASSVTIGSITGIVVAVLLLVALVTVLLYLFLIRRPHNKSSNSDISITEIPSANGQPSTSITVSLLSLWMDLTSGLINIQLMPHYPVISESVTLSVTGVTGKILSIAWYKGINTTPEYHILTYLPANPSPLLPGPLYVSQIRPFPDGSLLISDLNIADTGNYTVKMQTESTAEQATVILTVYEHPPPSEPNVGLIIGIVVAVLLAVTLVAASSYLFIVCKRRKKPSNNMNSVMEEPASNGLVGSPSMEQPELQYADIEFKNKNTRKQQPLSGTMHEDGSPPMQPPPENIVYSELRLQ
ncbi:carcinoembryonic antigen-related cell adhesion molecule 21-like [Pseudophryne corroboree]|uniref:carcinoembryonic antigen-related cell adhesion molecule 21-like n=1 Tax=Pseudophryne corroboree TaxID=495146 RepID=UPI00308157AC